MNNCFSINYRLLKIISIVCFLQTRLFTEKFSRTGTIHPGIFRGRALSGSFSADGHYINNSRHLARKYARISVSADITCSEKRTVFRERSSRKTVRFKEQIMSKDKYPSIFSPQMEAIVFIILQIFFATRAVLKIGVYSRIFPSFGWGIFRHLMRLDQSRTSEKI